MFSTVAGASKFKIPSFVEPMASRIAKKTDNNYYYIATVNHKVIIVTKIGNI